LLAHWLYSDANNISLSRKQKIANEFKDWQPKQIKRSFISEKMKNVFQDLIP